jgi:hypothetical protein
MMTAQPKVVHLDSMRFARISDSTADTAHALILSGELSPVDSNRMAIVRDRCRARAIAFRNGDFDE